MIKQFVGSDFCLKCKGCCRFAETCSVWLPTLLDQEIEILLKNDIPPSVISKDKQICVIPNQEENNFYCSFLDREGNKCQIYSFRPLECQLYPFLINRRGNKVFLALDLNCPIAKEKESSIEFKEYTRYLIDILKSQDYKELFGKNPQIVKAYPNVLDLGEI